MKKILIVLVTVVSLGLIGSQALACYWDGYYGGPMGGPMMGGPMMGGPMMGGYNTGGMPGGSYQSFLNDTAKLRQEFAAKRGEYDALMAQANPDPQKAGQLSQEIAGLHDQLQAKAQGYGTAAPGPYGAPRGGYGYGGGYGGWNCW